MSTILDKIQKLLSLANSPNENEAAMAAAKAQELMAIHGIESVEVDNTEADIDRVAIETSGKMPNWKKVLATAVATNNFCKCLICYNYMGTHVEYIGTKLHITNATLIYQYLSQAIERVLKANPAPHGYSTKSWNTNFRLGAANRIWQRLNEKTANMKANGIPTAGVSALAIVNEWDKHDAAIAEYLGDSKPREKKLNYTSDSAYVAGSLGADDIGLDAQIGNGLYLKGS